MDRVLQQDGSRGAAGATSGSYAADLADIKTTESNILHQIADLR